MKTAPEWSRDALNAYVDGELEPATAAEVAAAIALDRDLAARVATLARLKATTGALGSATPVYAPPSVRVTRPGRWRLLAASLLLAIAVGGVASWELLGRTREPGWIESADRAHERWLGISVPGATVRAQEGDRFLRAAGLGAVGGIPDLSAAQLSLAFLSTTADESGVVDGVYAGYVGVHGCRLGVWMGRPAPGFPEQFDEHRLSSLAAYAWRANDIAYVVLARGMDEARLQLLAQSVEELTRQRERLDDGIRTALSRAPGTGLPCGA